MAKQPIQNFIGKFDGGARPNLFEVELQVQGVPGVTFTAESETKIYVKASSVPSSVTGAIPVNYMGRIVNIPGDRTYEDWTVTILNDEKLNLRRKFENWTNFFNDHEDNTPGGSGGGAAHMQALVNTVAVVRQLDRHHNVSREYTLRNLWCENVAAIDLTYDTPDSISEFQVTFKYHVLDISK
jgi:hypothetical protein